MKIRNWRALRKGALRGFTEVELGELIISDIAILDGKHGLFAALPRKDWQGRDGMRKTGQQIVSFIDKARAEAFSDALVSALQRAYPEDFNPNVRRLI